MKSRRTAITVRRAEPSDAEAIHATFAMPKVMAGTLQLPLPGVEMWRRRLAEFPADDFLLVAEVGGRVVGNLGLHAAGKAPRRRHAGAIGICVRDDWHHRGVGSALLTAAIDLADNWINYKRLELTVYTDNEAALALYRKFGFTIEGTLRAYAYRGGRYVDAYTMARVREDATMAKRAAGAAKAPRAIKTRKPARSAKARKAA